MMAPAAVAAAVQPPEVQFAQRLAGNEKRVRDRALKKLRGYISLRTQSPEGSFNHDEFLKIWKGLFYCMWMQDKPLLQEELSNNISQLVHVIENMDARHLFIQTFWQTMNREWNGIDRLRLDKFYMLIRMVLRQSFEVLRRNGWNESFTEPFLGLLMKEIMHSESNAPVGIKLHFVDIYLEELANVGSKELTADQNLKFIEPFCKIAIKTKDHLVLQAIMRGIFETIVDQSPFAIEDLMKELKAGSDDPSEDEWSDEECKVLAKDRSLSSKRSPGFEAQENPGEDASDNIGPVLQFDYKSVADTLFGLASRRNTPVFNRKRIYKLVKKFQDLSEGNFPQDDFPEEVSTDEDDDTFSRRKQKRKHLRSLDKANLEKENTENRRITVEGDNMDLQRKKRKKRKRKSNQNVGSLAATASNEKGPISSEESNDLTQNGELIHIKKRKKKSLSIEANEIGSSPSSFGRLTDTSVQNTLTCLVSNVNKCPKKKNGRQKVSIATVQQNGYIHTGPKRDPGCCTPGDHEDNKVTNKKQKIESGILSGNTVSDAVVKQAEKESPVGSASTVFPKVKLKKKKKLGSLVKIGGSKQKKVSLIKKKKIKEVLNSVSENEVEAESKSNKAQKSDAAILIKKKQAKAENDFVKFEKATVPKPAFFRKTTRRITSMQLSKLQSSNSKKVTFGLNKNMTAEFKKTDKSILVSPQGASRVAFNPEQKPPHGVLKSSGSPAGTPPIKTSFAMAAKKRPTAMDFF